MNFLINEIQALEDDEENIWKKLNQLTALKHLTKNKTEATTKKDISNTLTETFSANSSLNNSNPHFLTFKSRETKTQLQVQKF